ncbi:MAG: DUF229 domain-containing protein [Nitrospiraceae bacterium]|nr:MAG: DUF229 domain-containing protein [Nitrospiraceae bacterium]
MKLSFWKFFRLVFVVFSLYLLGDVFFRWDGFRLHSAITDFIPSVALITILWTVISFLTAALVWLSLGIALRMCRFVYFRFTFEQIVVYFGVLIILGITVWKGKQLFWPLIQTSQLTKFTVFLCIALISLFITLRFNHKAEEWLNTINNRINPLVWIFGLIFLLSVPVVIYVSLSKDNNQVRLQVGTKRVVSEKTKPNIIFVTFDALSAKDMSTYGYSRLTTPFITEWANEAVIFTNLKASSNWTVPTVASLMTGKRPWTHRVAQFQGATPEKSSIESLPLLLKEHGYFNMAFIANTLASVKSMGIENSFDISPLPMEFSIPHSLVGDGLNVLGTVDKFLYKQFANHFTLHDWLLKEDFIFGKFLNIVSRNISDTTTPPIEVFNRFFDIMNANPPEPYFAWIHIFPPHDPYLPPQPFKGMYNNSDQFRTYKSQDAIRLASHKYLFRYQPYPPEFQPSMDLLRSNYDEFIRYCDHAFENFIKKLKDMNKLGNTVIILSADHGESFENGYHTHGGPFLNEAVSHIPLIIKVSNRNEGQSISELIEQVDIPATILDFAGISIPDWMEGRSLLPLMTGADFNTKQVFSMNIRMSSQKNRKIESGSFAVWEGDFKLVYFLDSKWEKTFLYNLREDPDETRNIFEKEIETGQHLLNLILEKLKLVK